MYLWLQEGLRPDSSLQGRCLRYMANTTRLKCAGKGKRDTANPFLRSKESMYRLPIWLTSVQYYLYSGIFLHKSEGAVKLLRPFLPGMADLHGPTPCTNDKNKIKPQIRAMVSVDGAVKELERANQD